MFVNPSTVIVRPQEPFANQLMACAMNPKKARRQIGPRRFFL
jgi:hypothetical protein